MNYQARQRRCLAAVREQGLDWLLVTHPANIRYLCGFTGSSGVLLLGKRGALYTDGRYREQARAEVEGASVVVSPAPLQAAAKGQVGQAGRVGIEAEHVSVATQAALRRALGEGTRLRSTAGLVEGMRMVKEAGEIRLLRRAADLGARLFEVAVNAIRPGLPETEIAAELEYAARRGGAAGMSFETIVAAGPRSARPHGVASAQRIPRKGFVVLDFGVILGGYCSDMTRTVHVGEAAGEARRMYEAVRRAQEAAIATVRPGAPAGEVDAAARKVLAEEGWGEYFTHSTGHGVGLEVHEPPRLGRGQKERLREGMVVTIEPGIYVPGRGGVRIEDMVVVTRQGCEVLAPATKELIELQTVSFSR